MWWQGCDSVIEKCTKYIGKTVLATIHGELIDVVVDTTVKLNGDMYRVAQITDIIDTNSDHTYITREVRMVNKVYY